VCLLLNGKCSGHHDQVVPILAVDRGILNVPLDGSGHLSSVSAEGCVLVETGTQTWPREEEYLN